MPALFLLCTARSGTPLSTVVSLPNRLAFAYMDRPKSAPEYIFKNGVITGNGAGLETDALQ